MSIFYDFLGYRQFVEGLGTFGGHIIYLNLGEQQGTDAQGNYTELFKSYMMAFNIRYGTQISQKQSVGMNFKVFHQKLADDTTEGETGDPFSTDFAFDIGYLQKFGKNSQHSFGFSIQNIGPPIDFTVYRKDEYKIASQKCLNVNDTEYSKVCNQWSEGIFKIFDSFPRFDWE